MKFSYNIEKNAELLASRDIGFEEIIEAINNGNLITVKKHHNQDKYPNQKIMYVKCLDYVYLVPYILQDDGVIFLKTLYPSRAATKKYLLN